MAIAGKLFASCFVLFILRFSGSNADSLMNGTVYYAEGKYHIEFGILDKDHGVAYGTYEDLIDTTGWGVLNIASGVGKASYSDQTIMFTAGYLEGALTARRINENYMNIYDLYFSKSSESFLKTVGKWFDDQEEWMRSKIASGSNSSSLWRQMGNIISQFDGLIAGYTDYPATEKRLRNKQRHDLTTSSIQDGLLLQKHMVTSK